MLQYRHTQFAAMWLILAGFVPLAVAGALRSGNSILLAVMLVVAAVVLLLAACFRRLMVALSVSASVERR